MINSKFTRVALALALGLILVGSFSAQNAPTVTDQSLIKDLKWRNIGPANMVGRISAFDALDKDFTHVLVAGASGGVFKSINAGTTWEPIFDKYGSASIGDVAFFQKDPNIIWVGTGEECVRNSVAWGDGIYKSTDGGKTFTHMGLKTTQTIGRVLTHPTDPEHRLRGGGGPSLGLHRRPRPVQDDRRRQDLDQARPAACPNDGKTGAIDLVMDPTESRTSSTSRSGSGCASPGASIPAARTAASSRSTDAGKTWTKLTKGLPAGRYRPDRPGHLPQQSQGPRWPSSSTASSRGRQIVEAASPRTIPTTPT